MAMRNLLTDLRFGTRLLRKAPAFTAVAILTMALGIAANTTVFSWIDGLLLRPFPGVAEGDELAVMEMVTADAPNGGTMTSYLDYRDYRDNLKLVSGLAAHHEYAFSLGESANGQTVWGEVVSGNYFSVLGVKPALGRVFTREEFDDKPGAHPVVVISHGLWRTRFHSDASVIGKTLHVNRRDLTIVGVAQREFHGTFQPVVIDLWIPLAMGPQVGALDASTFTNRGNRNLYVMARLKPGVDVEQARAEAVTVARNLATAFPQTNRKASAVILPVWRAHRGTPELLGGPLRILMAVAILVLLIVCANIANLLLARAVSRQKEFGVRLALGAARRRIAGQLIAETSLLALGGAIAAIPLTLWMSDSLPSLVPKLGVSVAVGMDLNGRVLAFTILVCACSVLLSGAAPALFALRSDLNDTLKEGGRSGKSGTHSNRMRSLLVISEVALAAVALIGAGLFVRSFQNARNTHPGFDKNNVLLARFYVAGAGYSLPQVERFCLRLSERLQALPGVTAVNYADYAPLGSSAGPYTNVAPEGYLPAAGENTAFNRTIVAPGHFSTLRIALLEGRDFAGNDDAAGMPVAIVNQAFARHYFKGANPVGRKIRFWGKPATIVGLVADTRYFSPTAPPVPHFYAPFRQTYRGGEVYFFARTAGDPHHSMLAFRRAIAEVEPNIPYQALSLADWSELTLLSHKVAAALLAALGLIALMLAAIGLYSVMAYAVSQRTQEIGIRMALGARPGHVLGAVLLQGMGLTALGLLAGIAASLAAMRVVAAMLVGVSAKDPLTFAAAACFLALVALLASYMPARRAMSVDPMVALRCE